MKNYQNSEAKTDSSENQIDLSNKPKIRCAIYTRKSSEDGLEQDFNSIDAQRLSGENFIASQVSKGWVMIPEYYDDGGFSGGTLERPALKRLFNDIRNKKIDCVVIYKIDRLSRSLFDFQQIIELFDQYKVSFASVTQNFTTDDSVGRLMLNVMLSFAQYERELTGERKLMPQKRKECGWAELFL
jgi:DNA invertase Pin-like site-specific DNA recombinase